MKSKELSLIKKILDVSFGLKESLGYLEVIPALKTFL